MEKIKFINQNHVQQISNEVLKRDASISGPSENSYKRWNTKVANMLNRITDKDKLNMKDITAVAIYLDHANTCEQAQLLKEKAIKELEEHSDTMRCNIIKATLYSKMLSRLLRAKHSDGTKESKKLKQIFKETLIRLIIHCRMEKFPDNHNHEAAAFIRGGHFMRDASLIKRGLRILKNSGEMESFSAILREVENYRVTSLSD